MIREELPNGMRVLVKANRLSPSISVRLCLHTGSIDDPPDQEGLALATALLLEEGTRRRRGKEIDEMIDFLGAETDVLVDKHSTVLVASFLKKDVEKMLRLLRELVCEPVFPAGEVRKVKDQMIASIREEEHDTRIVSLRALSRLLYPRRHPYRRPGGGTRRSVRSLERGDAARFHRDHYHPNGAILVIVGDLVERDALRLSKSIFRSWRKPGAPLPRTVPDAAGPRRPSSRALTIPDKTQCDLVCGFVGIRRSDHDFYSTAVMNQIFGAFGLGGRLGTRIREEEGLAYYAGSSFRASVGPGPFLIRAGVHPDHVGRALRIVREEIGKIRERMVRTEELRETQSYLIDSIPLKLETNDGVASFLLSQEYFGLGRGYLKRFPDLIRSVTREDVRRVARRLLREDLLTVTVAGPPLPSPLEGFLPPQ
jgi:zinc protease